MKEIQLINTTKNTLIIDNRYINPHSSFTLTEEQFASDDAKHYLDEGMIVRTDIENPPNKSTIQNSITEDSIPSILIAMPVRNSSNHLMDCLTTLTSMDYPHDKLRFAFVYGESTDNTLDIIKSAFRKTDLNYEIHNDPPYENPTGNSLYIAESMNVLSAHLKDEEFVLFLDSDIISIPPNTLKELIKADKDIIAPIPKYKHRGRLLFYDYYGFRINGKTTEYLQHNPNHEFFCGKEPIRLDSIGTCVLVKRKVIKDISWRNPFPWMRFCRDARKNGYLVWTAPYLTIIHANVLNETSHMPLEWFIKKGVVPISELDKMLGRKNSPPIENIPVKNTQEVKLPIEDRLKKQIKKFNQIKDGDSILIEHTSGWLGDKVGCLILVSELKRMFPKSIIDVFIDSKPTIFPTRYQGKKGVASLFEDVANHIFTDGDLYDTLNYDFSFQIGSANMDDIEVYDSRRGYPFISRPRQWAKQIGMSFCGDVNAIYRVKGADGERIRHKLKNLKKPVIAVAGFGTNRFKELSLMTSLNSKWQELIDKLNEMDYSVVALNYANFYFKNALCLSDLSTRELGYVLSKMNAVISIETGISHFAGVLRIPMVVLTGPSHALILRHYSKKRIVHKSHCTPCFCFPQHFRFDPNHECRTRKIPPFPCMKDITVEDIIKALKEVLPNGAN